MPPKKKPAARPARDLLTVELDPATRADLDALCAIEAEATGAKSPRRVASPLVRRLIRSARRAARGEKST